MNPVTLVEGMEPRTKFVLAFTVLGSVFGTLTANGVEVSIPTGPFGAALLASLVIYVTALDRDRGCDG